MSCDPVPGTAASLENEPLRLVDAGRACDRRPALDGSSGRKRFSPAGCRLPPSAPNIGHERFSLLARENRYPRPVVAQGHALFRIMLWPNEAHPSAVPKSPPATAVLMEFVSRFERQIPADVSLYVRELYERNLTLQDLISTIAWRDPQCCSAI